MSKREMLDKNTDLQNRKKKKRKKLIYWLIIDISVAVIIFALLLYKPGNYKPVFVEDTNEVSPYLLAWSSEINHKVPSNKPFDIVITQEALNDIINRADWPIESEGVLIYAPTAQIDPNNVILMCTAKFESVEFIISIELNANIDGMTLLLSMKGFKMIHFF